jgi:chromosome segregation ATPase
MTELPVRYYAYLKRGIRGPFFPKELVVIAGFERATLICPEKALGQWTEASLNPEFQGLMDTPPVPPVKPKPPRTAEAAEELASKALLEKAISKNSSLEKEVRELRKAYNAEKAHFDSTIKKRESEVRALADKLKRNVEAVQTVKGEHPSWEMLYKTLKKRSEEKLAELTQAVAEKGTEIVRLKETIFEQTEAARDGARQAQTALSENEAETRELIADLRSQVEEKDMLARTLSENITSLLGKHEELQHIMLDERRDAELQNTKYCEEIGRLRSEMKWREQEIAKIREELTDAMHKVREFEAVD